MKGFDNKAGTLFGCSYALNLKIALPMIEEGFKNIGWFGPEDEWLSTVLCEKSEVMDNALIRFKTDSFCANALVKNIGNERRSPI